MHGLSNWSCVQKKWFHSPFGKHMGSVWMHDGRADCFPYPHDGPADYFFYPHDDQINCFAYNLGFIISHGLFQDSSGNINEYKYIETDINTCDCSHPGNLYTLSFHVLIHTRNLYICTWINKSQQQINVYFILIWISIFWSFWH